MRRTLPALSPLRLASALLAASTAIFVASGCQQEKKDLLALPKGYDPAGADLTFNNLRDGGSYSLSVYFE